MDKNKKIIILKYNRLMKENVIMSKFVIVPDSTSDVNKMLRERFNVTDIVKGPITINGESINVNGDWDTYQSKEFWAMLKNKKNQISTGAASVS